MAKSKRQREEACYICGHYHDYEGGEKCATCGHVLHGAAQCSAPDSSAMPTTILPGFLYLGSYDHASRLELLKTMGIDHILSLVPSCPELYKNTLSYHTVKSTPPDWQECFAYIDHVRTAQERVVVHCMSGVTKSPAVVIAYLMKLRGWPLAESFTWVKDRHPGMELSQADAERLQQAEPALLAQHEAAAAEARAAGGGAGPASNGRPQPHPRPQWTWPAAQLQPSQLQPGEPSLAFQQGGGQPQGAFVFGAGCRHPPPGGGTSMDV